jgi:hypothetical protein
MIDLDDCSSKWLITKEIQLDNICERLSQLVEPGVAEEEDE